MKVGVYFCNCGTNITDKVDAAKVEEKILGNTNVNYFKTFGFLCAEKGKDFLEKDITAEKPDRIVIAACSPREHEHTFMEILSKSGINPYLMQMVNIREFISWVTEDKTKATEKAISYLNGAVARVLHHEPLEKTELEVNSDVLVLGAGPAGLKAALSLAESGRSVTIVEKTPLIGGMPVRYEDIFPGMECGPCMLEPMLSEVLHGEYSKNINILTLSEIIETTGYFGNFIIKVNQSPRFVDIGKCIGCMACVEACPVSTKNEFNYGLNEKKAISFPFLGALPYAPYIDPNTCVRFKGKNCNLCKEACKSICGADDAINFNDEERIINKNVGAVITAVGASLYDCKKFQNLGYNKIPDVYTSVEFERITSSNGPTNGEIKTQDDKQPEAVAIIHCVGSLDRDHIEYCSGICCMCAFKYNHIITSRHPETRIYHFYKELVVPGKEDYKLYAHAMENANTSFIRYKDINSLTVKLRNGKKVVELSLPNAKKGIVKVDMIILCPALVPSAETEKLSLDLEAPVDGLGFFEETHGRIDSARSAMKGIYLAGTCQSPMDIQKAINQGMAAAGYIFAELSYGKKVVIDPITASVDAERCSGCRICVPVCPYKAISFNAETETAEVNALLCQGCGTCVSACPAAVIKGNHFTAEEISAEIEGILK